MSRWRTTIPVPENRLEDQDPQREVRLPAGIGLGYHEHHSEARGPAAGSANKNGREERLQLLEILRQAKAHEMPGIWLLLFGMRQATPLDKHMDVQGQEKAFILA